MAGKFELWSSGTALRGANIFERARVESFDGGPGSPFVPEYPDDLFDRLRQAGANLAVLSIGGAYQIEHPYALNLEAVKLMDRMVDRADGAGLFVVLSPRTAPGRNDSDVLFDVLGDHLRRDRSLFTREGPAWRGFLRMWRFMANHYKDRRVVAGYDLLVEPFAQDEDEGAFRDNWFELANRAIAVIRSVDAETPILVQPPQWGGPGALASWRMPEGHNLVCSVHPYEPNDYCLNCGSDEAPDLQFDFSRTQAAYQQMRDFAVQQGSPLAATEFGARHNCVEVTGFLRRQLELLEQNGFNHAAWVWGDDSDRRDVQHDAVIHVFTENWSRNTRFP